MIFKGLSASKNCLRPESASLKLFKSVSQHIQRVEESTQDDLIRFYRHCVTVNFLSFSFIIITAQKNEEILYPAGIYMFKVNNRTLEQGVKYVQS